MISDSQRGISDPGCFARSRFSISFGEAGVYFALIGYEFETEFDVKGGCNGEEVCMTPDGMT